MHCIQILSNILKFHFIIILGHTQDLDVVVKTLYEKEKRKMIAVGFSLGGNILMKYLGESEDNQKMFHFAICVCQGYDVTEYENCFFNAL